jgi:hypothetical protein
MLPEQVSDSFHWFTKSLFTHVGCDDDGHSTVNEVFAVAEQCLQDRQTTKCTNEGPDVNDVFRRGLDRVGAMT